MNNKDYNREEQKTDVKIGLIHSTLYQDANAVWNICCQLCTAYERKAFLDGLQYGAHLMTELKGL